MMRYYACALLIAACWAGTQAEAHAGRHWISNYIDAQGGCGSAAGPLSFVLSGEGLQAPFGRPGADWSDDDLSVLPHILTECERTAARTNNPILADEVRREAQSILSRVPGIVRSARAERERQEAQLVARKEIAKGRMSSAKEQAGESKAAAEADVRQLEAEADRAEAEARLTAQRQDQARRSARERVARAEAETLRLDNRTEPTDHPSDRQGFPFSENELMRRLTTGSAKGFVLPNLRVEMENAEVRTHVYEIGRKNMLYAMEYKTNRRVRDFSVLMAADDRDNISIGLILFSTALDIVSPGLASIDRSNILDPMMRHVLQDDGVYQKDLETCKMECIQMQGVFCVFIAK